MAIDMNWNIYCDWQMINIRQQSPWPIGCILKITMYCNWHTIPWRLMRYHSRGRKLSTQDSDTSGLWRKLFAFISQCHTWVWVGDWSQKSVPYSLFSWPGTVDENKVFAHDCGVTALLDLGLWKTLTVRFQKLTYPPLLPHISSDLCNVNRESAFSLSSLR